MIAVVRSRLRATELVGKRRFVQFFLHARPADQLRNSRTLSASAYSLLSQTQPLTIRDVVTPPSSNSTSHPSVNSISLFLSLLHIWAAHLKAARVLMVCMLRCIFSLSLSLSRRFCCFPVIVVVVIVLLLIASRARKNLHGRREGDVLVCFPLMRASDSLASSPFLSLSLTVLQPPPGCRATTISVWQPLYYTNHANTNNRAWLKVNKAIMVMTGKRLTSGFERYIVPATAALHPDPPSYYPLISTI